jgi:hypothetical protein
MNLLKSDSFILLDMGIGLMTREIFGADYLQYRQEKQMYV